jgi:glycosyltransferase involved in cell wall biosynthesis
MSILWRAGHRLASTIPRDGIAGRLAWRLLTPLVHEGPAGTLRRAWRLVRPWSPRDLAKRAAALPLGDRPIVVLPSVDWDISLFQRPQQLARALAALGRPVLYVALNQALRGGLEQRADNLWLIEDAGAALAARPDAAILFSSTAPAYFTADFVAGRTLVYDFLDDQHDSVYDASATRSRHETLIRAADLVVVTADRLRDQVTSVARRIAEIPNAADVEHFRPRGRAIPRELRGYHNIIGYYGALAAWVDYALLEELAYRGHTVVLIGVPYDRSLEESQILRYPNILALGPRPYSDLPAYLEHFDVAIVPFIKSPMTDAVSPIKLFEYMAAEKPIVTTNLHECTKYPGIQIATDTFSFTHAIAHALRREPDRSSLRATAEANSWEARARALLAALP